MNTKSLLYKIMVLIVAALVVNQIACSKASFNKTDDTVSQNSPGDDDFGDSDKDRDDEKTVRCDDRFPEICDVGDTGITTRRRSNFDEENCFRTTYTFSSYDYMLESKVVKFYLYDLDDNRLRESDIEFIDGMYTLSVQANGRYVGFDKSLFKKTNQIAPSAMGQEIILRYCVNN